MPIVFIIGIMGIALEDVIKVNKAATAVGMSILLWLIFLLNAEHFFVINPPKHIAEYTKVFPQLAEMSVHDVAFDFLELHLVKGLGDVSTTLFFVLGSMAIIDVVDSHGGFSIISHSIKSNGQRRLLWILSLVTFFMSILLGNLPTVIVLVSIVRKLIPERKVRMVFASMIVIAANAGGSCSPIGDVTTLLLWTGGNVTALHQLTTLFVPSFVMLLLPLSIATMMLPKGAVVTREVSDPINVNPRMRQTVLLVGLGSLAMVPVLQTYCIPS